jgi:hypothetical protein
MRNLIILATGLAVLGVSVPLVTDARAEETVVIKRGYGPGWHRGWYGERGWRGEFGDRRIYIERHHDRGWHRGWYGDRY